MAARRVDPLKKFGRRVRERRQRLGLSPERLGFEAGLPATYISGIERGVRNIGLRNVVAVARVRNIGLRNVVAVARALQIDPCRLVAGLR